jgi:uncharacterized protein (DUF427 family)
MGPVSGGRQAEDVGRHPGGGCAFRAFACPNAPMRAPCALTASGLRSRIGPGGRERHPMKATWNGKTIAESDDTVVVEGNHYFPESTLKREYVTFSNHRSSCPWKGQAHYYSLIVDGDMNENAVWYYPEPSDAAKEIKGRVAFWKGVKVER